MESGERAIVGVNQHVAVGEPRPEIARVSPEVECGQKARLAELKRSRDGEAVTSALRAVEAAARGTDNVLPHILHAVKSQATLGEVSDVMRGVFGVYRERATL